MYDSYDAKQQIIAFCFSSTRVVPWLQTHASVINSIHFNYYFEHEVHWTLKKNSAALVQLHFMASSQWETSRNFPKGSSVVCLIKPGLGLPDKKKKKIPQAASQHQLVPWVITELKPLPLCDTLWQRTIYDRSGSSRGYVQALLSAVLSPSHSSYKQNDEPLQSHGPQSSSKRLRLLPLLSPARMAHTVGAHEPRFQMKLREIKCWHRVPEPRWGYYLMHLLLNSQWYYCITATNINAPY